MFSLYKKSFTNMFDTYKTYDVGEVIQSFSEMDLINPTHNKFIIKPDGSVISISGYEPSYFMVEYTSIGGVCISGGRRRGDSLIKYNHEPICIHDRMQ